MTWMAKVFGDGATLRKQLFHRGDAASQIRLVENKTVLRWIFLPLMESGTISGATGATTTLGLLVQSVKSK